MTSDASSPTRDFPPHIPLKRALEDDHIPTVSSPLNPDFSKSKDDAPMARERAARAKKESLKKRESKGASLAPEPRAIPDPKPNKHKRQKSTAAPLRYKLPPPKPSDFEPPHGPAFTPHHEITAPDGSQIEFHETTEHVRNKKGYSYTLCIADPTFKSSLYYRQTESEPFGPRISFEDTGAHIFLDTSGRHITTNKGYRMAKANVAVREGRFYWECKITRGVSKTRSWDGESAEPHVRMGWARREATLEAPVGFDAYSYGFRDVAGQKVWMSRPKDFFPSGEDIAEGDVIGLEINLPSETLHRKVVEGHYNPAVDLDDDEVDKGREAADIIRDRVPIRFRSNVYFEQIDYHPSKELSDLFNPSPVISSTGGVGASSQAPGPTHPFSSLRTLPHSYIKIYKNGVLMGTPFTELLSFLPPASKPETGQVGARDGLDDGMLGYYPAISVFRGGAAEANFGPDFWYPPPGLDDHDDEVDMVGSDQPPVQKVPKLRAIAERYDEQIAEDIVRDIMDEVDFFMQDGGISGSGAGRGIIPESVSDVTMDGLGDGVLASEDIKELVQDDE